MLKEYFKLKTAEFAFKAEQFVAGLEMTRRYEAAGYGRRLDKTDRRTRGPVIDQMDSLDKLRGFSRTMVRDNPYAKRAIAVRASNTVGSGVKPAFRGKNAKTAKEEWVKWAETSKCDFFGQKNFYGLQKLGFRTMSESGDWLILRRWTEESPVGFDLQMLESDYLDETLTRPSDGGGWIMQGVEFDRQGRIKGYWIHENHPKDVNSVSQTPQFVPKKDLIHAYEVLRPGQLRGIPAGVSSFIRLKDFDEFQDAELYKQKVAACFVMAVKTAQSMPGQNLGGDDTTELVSRMEPGQVIELPFGKEATFSQPPTLSGNSDYNSTILHAIAAGYDIPYEDLTGDYSQVTFSSARMSALRFADQIESWQDDILISMVCERVYQWFLEGLAIKKGIFIEPTTTWTTPRRAMVDPLKESSALIKLIDAGIQSRQEAIRQLGGDPDDVNAEIDEDLARDKKLSEKYKVEVGSFLPDSLKPQAAQPAVGKTPAKPKSKKV